MACSVTPLFASFFGFWGFIPFHSTCLAGNWALQRNQKERQPFTGRGSIAECRDKLGSTQILSIPRKALAFQTAGRERCQLRGSFEKELCRIIHGAHHFVVRICSVQYLSGGITLKHATLHHNNTYIIFNVRIRCVAGPVLA